MKSSTTDILRIAAEAPILVSCCIVATVNQPLTKTTHSPQTATPSLPSHGVVNVPRKQPYNRVSQFRRQMPQAKGTATRERGRNTLPTPSRANRPSEFSCKKYHQSVNPVSLCPFSHKEPNCIDQHSSCNRPNIHRERLKHPTNSRLNAH